MDEVVAVGSIDSTDESLLEGDCEIEQLDLMPSTSKDGEQWYHVPTMNERRTCSGNTFRAIPGFLKIV